MNTFARILITALLSAVLFTCAKNPVTGKNQLMLVSEKWELDIGKQYYSPMRQSQGGDYTVDPAVEIYVREVGNKLASVSDRKLPYEFNVINDSTPNAWALPGGKISINRGLLVELESEAELAAVLGHEVVHAAARHGASAQTRGVGAQIATIGAVVGLSGKIGAQGAQLLGAGAAQLVNQSYGRKAERESDEFGMLYMKRAGYDVQGAVGLQQKFVKLSRSRGKTSRFEQLFSSHPSSDARVSHNRETAARLGTGGEVGADRYKQKMSRMLKAKPAYDFYDKAKAVFKEGNTREASSLLKKAIRLEPREALFHSAMGDISSETNNHSAAIKHYNKAISLNKQFYYPFLKRGQASFMSKRYASAEKDLNQSLAMLPTGAAHNLLGNISSTKNNRAGAMKHYKEAIRYGGEDAKAAYSKLLKIDLGSNPGEYIQAAAGLTAKGTLGIKLSNPTPENIQGIVYSITSRSNGKSQRGSFNGVLPGGKSTVVDTGLSIAKSELSDVAVQVTKARLAR